MPLRNWNSLTLLVLLAAAGAAAAQNQAGGPPAQPPQPSAAKALDRREALRLYGLGLLCERDNRLLEAARHFESAAKLDPEAAAVHKALIPLYVALQRHADALASCRHALDGDPGDYETWYVGARLHKEQGQLAEARAALAKALACPKLKDQPELALRIASELGLMCEEAKDLDGALAAYATLAKTLEHPEPLMESGVVTRADVNARAAEVYEHAGTLCLQAKRFDEALQAFAKAQAKIEPEALKKRLSLHLAKVHYAQGKWGEALAALDRYLETQPPGTEAYELKITLLQQLGRSAEVLPQLESYAGRERHNLALQLLLADRYAKEQRWTQAERRYQEVAKESPGPEVYRGLFTLYKVQDDREGHRNHLRAALTMLDGALAEATTKDNVPGDAAAAARARAMLAVLRENADLVKALLPVAVQELSGGLRPSGGNLRSPQTCVFLAVLATRNHQLDEAERLYRQCLNQANPQVEGDAYDGLIKILFAKHKYKDVVAVCRDGLKKAHATNRLLFHYSLTEAWLQLGNTAEALKEADQAVELADDANRLRMRRVRVGILTAAGKFDRAEAECQAMFKDYTQPGDVRNVRYSLSNVYSTAHRYEQAEEQLRLILKDDPNDDGANNDLGYIMADRGKNLEEAEQLIRRAIRLEREQRKGAKVGPDGDQDHAAYIDSLGWVLFRRGQVQEARQELERATSLPDGEDPVIWDHLGDVCLRLGQPERARAAWQKAEKLYEGDPRRRQDGPFQELKRKLKLLKSNTAR